MTEIADEMVAVINRDYLIKGIGAREAVRRILELAEKQKGIPKGEPVADRDDAGNPIPSEVSPRYDQQQQRGRRPEGVKLISGGYERGDGSIAWLMPEDIASEGDKEAGTRELMNEPDTLSKGSVMKCTICRTVYYEEDGCSCPPRSGFDGSKR